MSKKISDDILTIRIAKKLMDKFRIKCEQESKNMSEAIRAMIREYTKEIK